MRLFLALIFISSFVYGYTIHKGWNYIGVYEDTTIYDFKKKYNLSKVYAYKNDQWFSDGDIETTDGLFIYSSRIFDISPNYKDIKYSSSINLYQGWSLKAIGVRSSVRASIFGNDVKVWKYSSSSNTWNSYLPQTSNNDDLFLDFMNGFLIYTPKDKVVDIEKKQIDMIDFKSTNAIYRYLEKIVLKNRAYSNYNPRPAVYQDLGVKKVLSAPKASSENSVQDSTSTNVQVNGVDEADIIKNNENGVFYIAKSKLYMQDFDELFLNVNRPIDITAVDLNNKKLIPYNMYLRNNTLIVLYRKNNLYDIYRSKIYPPRSSNLSSVIKIYDVSNMNHIDEKHTIELDGSVVNSRFIGNRMYLLSKYRVYFDTVYKNSVMPCVQKDNNCQDIIYDVSTIVSKHINPQVSIDLKRYDLFTRGKFYAPYNVSNYVNVTNVVSFDIFDVKSLKSLSFLINTQDMYMSRKNLYISGRYYTNDKNLPNENTLIYKIALDDNITYKGNIIISGSSLNQFSFDEYKEDLRVATTRRESNANIDNRISIIREVNGKLKIISTLKGLGKKGERIRAVRFMNDRAYVVTFKQTDPFYTIDLKDSFSPKKAGILNVSGFSTYLQDIGDNKILAIAREANQKGVVTAMKIQLFDVEHLSYPRLMSKYLFSPSYSSNALYNHKAVTYRPSDNRLAIAVNSYKNKYYGYYIFSLKDTIRKTQDVKVEQYNYNGRSVILTHNKKDYILTLSNKLKLEELK